MRTSAILELLRLDVDTQDGHRAAAPNAGCAAGRLNYGATKVELASLRVTHGCHESKRRWSELRPSPFSGCGLSRTFEDDLENARLRSMPL